MLDSGAFTKTNKSYKVNIKQKKKSALALISFLVLCATNVYADSPISIDASVDKSRVTTGDIIIYTITLRHDMDIKPSMPDFSVIAGFEVNEKLASNPLKVQGQIEQKYSANLRADQIGSYTIPPISISFEVTKSPPGNSIPGKIRAPEVIIEVASVLNLQGEASDIKDIKGILQVDRNWTPWLFWGLNIILLMLVLYLLWKYRKEKHEPSFEKTLEIPIHEIALRDLDTLKQKGFLNRGDAREHFFELSEIFRRYLGQRYDFPAPDWTTEEITEYFQKQSESESSSYFEAIRILTKSDLIKFAQFKALPRADEIESVRKFILATRKHIDIGLYSN